MELKLDAFCIDNLLDSGILYRKGETFWFKLEDGYLMLWKDGNSHHTYHNPQWLEE